MKENQILFSMNAYHGHFCGEPNYRPVAVLATKLPDGTIDLEFANEEGPVPHGYWNSDSNFIEKSMNQASKIFEQKESNATIAAMSI